MLSLCRSLLWAPFPPSFAWPPQTPRRLSARKQLPPFPPLSVISKPLSTKSFRTCRPNTSPKQSSMRMIWSLWTFSSISYVRAYRYCQMAFTLAFWLRFDVSIERRFKENGYAYHGFSIEYDFEEAISNTSCEWTRVSMRS